jgi:hypothetical protein
MKLKGGKLSTQLELENQHFDYVEIPCREGSTISIVANDDRGENFNVYILSSGDVQKAPVIGKVRDYDEKRALWKKGKGGKTKGDYTSDARDVLYIIFENPHSRKFNYLDISVAVDHPPLKVGDQPLQESFEVEAGYFETVEINGNAGDTIRVFGRVSKGNDIGAYVVAAIFATPDNIHLDKAYWSKEKTEEIDIEYHCTKTEPLLVVFDNGYSKLTTKTVDVSIQVISGEKAPEGQRFCKFCGAKIDADAAFCPRCGGQL